MSAFDPSCIDVEHFLNTLEVRNLSFATEEEMRFSCPFPNHDGADQNPSCYMNVDTSAFLCHGCKQRGNALTFTQIVLGISPLEAIRLLRQRYQPGAINPDERDVLKEIEKIINFENEQIIQPIIDENFVEKIAVDWESVDFAIRRKQYVPEPLSYMIERGFDAATLNEWDFGYDQISDRPVFTVREEQGKVIGFKGRAWREGQLPKYFVLGDKPGKEIKYGFPCYHTSQVVFGADRVKGDEEFVVVCEGELNAVSVNMKTGHTAVAINGSYFSSFHADVIKKKSDRVILFLDSDPAGESATWGWQDSKNRHHNGIVDELKDFVDVRICPAHEGDPASMSDNEIAACLKDSAHWLSIQLELC